MQLVGEPHEGYCLSELSRFLEFEGLVRVSDTDQAIKGLRTSSIRLKLDDPIQEIGDFLRPKRLVVPRTTFSESSSVRMPFAFGCRGIDHDTYQGVVTVFIRHFKEHV